MKTITPSLVIPQPAGTNHPTQGQLRLRSSDRIEAAKSAKSAAITRTTETAQPIQIKTKNSATRKVSLKAAQPTIIITSPTDKHILCGRGGAINHHKGNRAFRNIVSELRKEYLYASRRDKPVTVNKALDQLRENQMVFLKQLPNESKNQWIQEADITRIRRKITQLLREGAPAFRAEIESTRTKNLLAQQNDGQMRNKTWGLTLPHQYCAHPAHELLKETTRR